MAILQHLAGFALQQLVSGACKAAGVVASAQAGQVIAGFVGRQFTDQSKRLADALIRAADQAWRALEIALAGDSLWDRVMLTLARGEEQAFRAQVQAFLEVTPFVGLPGHTDEFRRLALSELRAARKVGLLTSGRLGPQALAEQVGHLVTFGDPAQLLDAQLQGLEALAAEVRQAGYPSLAHLLTLRPADGPPLIVVAVRYFFRRAIEEDSALFQGLVVAQLERLADVQEQGFGALADALDRHGYRIEQALANVQEVVVDTHATVKDIQQELKRVGQVVTQAVEQQHTLHRLADDSKPVPLSDSRRGEQDLRLDLLNTLLKTPHRQLDAIYPLHAEMVRKDPLFYVRLAAWYFERGEVRDHKEMVRRLTA